MGASVILNGRNQKKLDDIHVQLETGTLNIITADLTDMDSIISMMGKKTILEDLFLVLVCGQRVLCKAATDIM